MKLSIVAVLAACLAAACTNSQVVNDQPPDGEATIFAVSTDYTSTGLASTITVPDLAVTQNAVNGVASTDPVVRHLGDRLFVVNRLGADNVTVLDPVTLQLVAQISTGAGSNPQDVAAVGDTLFVPTFAGTGVVVLDLAHPDDGVVNTVDLSSLDSDGIPNCSAAAAVGGKVFVSCGLLDDNGDLSAQGPGRIAVIDATSHALITDFALNNDNPIGPFVALPELGGDLIIDTVPDYADLSQGCVERIATASPAASGCFIDHSDLGGLATGMADGGGSLWIAITEGWDDQDYQPLGKVQSFDLGTMTLASAPITADGERAFDLARCPTGHLAVADAAGGIRIYDADGVEVTTAPLDIGLPPIGGGLTCYLIRGFRRRAPAGGQTVDLGGNFEGLLVAGVAVVAAPAAGLARGLDAERRGVDQLAQPHRIGLAAAGQHQVGRTDRRWRRPRRPGPARPTPGFRGGPGPPCANTGRRDPGDRPGPGRLADPGLPADPGSPGFPARLWAPADRADRADRAGLPVPVGRSARARPAAPDRPAARAVPAVRSARRCRRRAPAGPGSATPPERRSCPAPRPRPAASPGRRPWPAARAPRSRPVACCPAGCTRPTPPPRPVPASTRVSDPASSAASV